MTDKPLTLMAVFAHPDDEVWTAGALAKYAAEGVRTVLVTATLGEEGQIRDPDLDPEQVRERLGEIRRAELQRSAEIIGIAQVYVLGYRDSGMVGTPANEDPRNFHNANPREAICRLVRLIRQERPHVVITDNERGTYGHPDHLATHRTTLAAFDAAADPAQCRESGLEPWQPQKLYYTAFARSDLLRMRDVFRERGISWEGEEDAEEWLEITVPDELVTTRINVVSYRSRVRDAMRAHRTQISADDPWLNLPDDLVAALQWSDTFTRARSLVDASLPEDDLFAGLRALDSARARAAVGDKAP